VEGEDAERKLAFDVGECVRDCGGGPETGSGVAAEGVEEGVVEGIEEDVYDCLG